MLFLFNEDKDNIEGYIGAAAFSEITYAVIRKILNKQNINIFLYKMPSKEVLGYDEISLWLKLKYIKIYEK
ncbi:hypothetical protein [Miniphocaeibacter massiliensis]|uniref:hypothetical protein n=1 Tax=Miniphocaeibacter massiliensis TaxID=2041841 RepID=UPI000C1C7CE0|nr:hypothetical protein [Miniphocaeibacter massiliensis]